MTQTVATDAFTGTDWTALTSHAADKGGTWLRNASTPGAQFYIYDDKIYCGAVNGSAGAALYLPVVPFSADYSVFADITFKTTTSHVGIAGRMSATANTYYAIYADPANVWVLLKRVNGVITILDNSVNCPTSGTYELELRMTGTTIAYYVDGALGASDTDSGITAAGYGGIRSGSTNGATTGKHLDNFRIVDGSTAPSPRSYAVGLVGL